SDPRALGLVVVLPPGIARVRHAGGEAEGDAARIQRLLEAAGYRIAWGPGFAPPADAGEGVRYLADGWLEEEEPQDARWRQYLYAGGLLWRRTLPPPAAAEPAPEMPGGPPWEALPEFAEVSPAVRAYWAWAT